MPRGGVSTALTAIGAAETSNKIMHGIRVVEEQLTLDGACLWNQLPAFSRPQSAQLCEWHLYIHDARFGLEDRVSGHRIRLG